MGILLYSISALIVHFHYEPQQQTSDHEATCLSQIDDQVIAPVRLTTTNTFKYYSLLVQQNTSATGTTYHTLGICYYVIKSDQITVRSQMYSYSSSGAEYFGRGWYCLKESSLSFNICLSAKNNDSGSSNLVLFNRYSEYDKYIYHPPATYWMHYPLHVNGSETNCTYYNITVPQDMFVYYVIDRPTNADLNFSITIERRFLNATDWLNVNPVCFNANENDAYTHYFSLFPPENSDYTLVAIVQYPGSTICNNAPAHVTLHYRGTPNKAIYIVLVIPIIGLSIIFSTFCVIPCLYFKCRRNV